jgi:hypothetical protein
MNFHVRFKAHKLEKRVLCMLKLEESCKKDLNNKNVAVEVPRK